MKKKEVLTQAQLNRWYAALEGKGKEVFIQTHGTLAKFRGDKCLGMCCLGVFLHVNDERPWSHPDHGQSTPTGVGAMLSSTWGKLFDNTFPVKLLKAELRKILKRSHMPVDQNSSQRIFANLNDSGEFSFKQIAKLARKVARK